MSINNPVFTKSKAKTVLNSLKKLDYPKSLVEIVIVEGNQIAKQRNYAIKHSTGEIIYLLDDDSETIPASLRMIASEFKNKSVAAVGGPSLTKKNGVFLSELIGYALETYFGAMRMRFRYSEQPNAVEGNEYQLIGANLALRKKIIEKIGLFNEKIVPNEETELLRRLKKLGFKLVYNKSLQVYRSHRTTPINLARQFYHYGVGRTKQMLYNGNWGDLIFILPVAFLVYILTLFLFSPTLYLLPLFIYAALAYLTSLKAAFKYKKFDIFFSLALIFPIIHSSYACGIVSELVNSTMFRKNKKTVLKKMKVSILKLSGL